MIFAYASCKWKCIFCSYIHTYTYIHIYIYIYYSSHRPLIFSAPCNTLESNLQIICNNDPSWKLIAFQLPFQKCTNPSAYFTYENVEPQITQESSRVFPISFTVLVTPNYEGTNYSELLGGKKKEWGKMNLLRLQIFFPSLL